MGNNEFSSNFLKKQKQRIHERINKYYNQERIKEELENGDVSPYTRYKQSVLVPILKKALKKIDSGQYGYCEKCAEKIERERLNIVPGAELCMKCIKVKAN